MAQALTQLYSFHFGRAWDDQFAGRQSDRASLLRAPLLSLRHLEPA